MINVIVNRNNSIKDIYPLFVGYEKCEPSHRFGPHTRDYYIIHFCLSGKGRLTDKYGTHEIREGELFIIRSREITVYTADEKDPWEYMWLAFLGDSCHIFSTEKSVYSFSRELAEKLKENIFSQNTSPYIYTSVIYELIHNLFLEKKEKNDTPSLIKKYIDYNYMYEISVSSLAKAYSFDRSYMFKLFKARYKMGIKEYITEVRMKNAKCFLSDGISVSKCATMVGYKDEFNFSRAFKNHTGISPSKWKNSTKQELLR